MKDSSGIGVGVVAYRIGGNQPPSIQKRDTLNLGDQQLVYNGELEGLTLGVEYISRIAERGKSYKVFSDNQAGLYRLRTPSDNPGQACQIRAIKAAQIVKEKGANIALEWVPGHEDVPGNEEADRLAKLASKDIANSTETSWAILGLKIKQLAKAEWQRAIRANDREKRVIGRLDTIDSTLRIPKGTKRVLASTFY